MSRFDDLISQFVNERPKDVPVVRATDEVINAPAPTDEELYDIAASRADDSGRSSPNQMRRDVQDLNPFQLLDRYGARKGSNIVSSLARQQSKYFDDKNAYRSITDVAADTAGNVVSGAVQTVGGLASLVGSGLSQGDKTLTALGLADERKDMGVSVAETFGELAEWKERNVNSDGQIAQARATAAEFRSRAIDDQADYERDVSQHGGFLAGLKRVGREVATASSVYAANPGSAGDVISEGVGSLAVGGPLIRGAQASALGAANLLARGGIISWGTKVGPIKAGSAMAAIGAMESGGAYQQAVQEVMSMNHAQLSETSSDYRELLGTGLSPEEARVRLASETGKMAAAITLPAAALSGKFVGGFEANPFAVGALSAGRRNITAETLEESFQSANSQFAGNIALKSKVDANQSLTDGIGRGIVEGAIGGFGSASVTQAPGITYETAAIPVRATMRGVGKVTDGVRKAGTPLYLSIMQRADKIREDNENSSPVSTDNVRNGLTSALGMFAQAKERVFGTETTQEEAPTPEVEEYLERLNQAAQFDPSELAEDTPSFITNELSESTDRLSAIEALMKVVQRSDEGSNEQTTAARYLLEMRNKYSDMIDYETAKAVEDLSEDSAPFEIMQQFENAFVSMNQNTKVKKALDLAEKSLATAASQGSAGVVGASEAVTPEGQNKIKNAIAVAEFAPTEADVKTNDTILEHASAGRITLTPYQQAAILASSALVRAEQNLLSAKEDLGLTTNTDIVSGEVITQRDTTKKHNQLSLSGHSRRIIGAFRAGDTDVATAYLQDLGMFAEHMQNKVRAYNEHFAQGGGREETGIRYQALLPNRQWVESSKRAYIQPTSQSSIAFAQTVAKEAEVVTSVLNALADAMPELNVPVLEFTGLSEQLQGNAADVAANYRAELKAARQDKPAESPSTTEATQSTSQTTSSAPAPAAIDATIADSGVSLDLINRAKKQGELDAEKSGRNAPPETFTDPEKVAWYEANLKAKAKASEALAEPDAVTSEEVAKAEPETQLDVPDVVVEAEPTPVSPEPVAEEPVQDELTFGALPPETAPQGLSAEFTNLVGQDADSSVQNGFLSAFKRGKGNLSRLRNSGGALTFLKQTLTSSNFYESITEDAVGAKQLTPQVISAYEDYLGNADTIVAGLNKRLVKFLAEPTSKKNAATNQETFLAEGKLNRYERGRVLNLLDQGPDGLAYNQELVDIAAIAALQWLRMAPRFQSVKEPEDVASILGVNQEQMYAALGGKYDAVVQAYDSGLTVTEASRSLGQMIREYWDVVPNKDGSKAQIEGIPEAMAKEILSVMAEAGALDLREPMKELFEQSPLKDGRSPYIVVPRKLDKDDPLNAFPDAIEKLVKVEPDRVNYVGSPPQKVAITQLHNNKAALTNQQKAALRARQNVAFSANLPMLYLYMAAGQEGIVDLHAGGSINPDQLNAQDQGTLEGRNITFISAFNSVQQLVVETQGFAEANGQAFEDVPVYFSYTFNKSNRLQMQGSNNPQSSKLMREVFMATKSTVNLQDKNGDSFKSWAVSLAQHLGEKVHLQSAETSINNVMGMLESDFPKSVSVLQEWVAAVEADTTSALPVDLLQIVKEEFGGPMEPAALHALVDYARYLNADSESRKAFSTAMYLEADGVTNGPINAMALFSPSEFTVDWVNNMARGGLLLGGEAQSLNEYAESSAFSGDLYKATTSKLQDLMSDLRSNLSESSQTKPIADQLENLMVLMDMFMGSDVVFDGESLTFERGIAKNPLTVTIYGSGANGIANKLTQVLSNAMYERMSAARKVLADSPEGTTLAQALFPADMDAEAKLERFGQAYNGLITDVAKQNADGSIEFQKGAAKDWKIDLREFSLTGAKFQNVQANLSALMVKPLRESIESTVGSPLTYTSTVIRRATQTQGIALQFAFKAELEKLLNEKAKDPEYVRTDYLSQKDLNQAFSNLGPLAPLISTGSQNYYIANSQRADTANMEFSRTLDGKLATPGYVEGPVDPGVKGIPALVIGSGDGMMMQLFASRPEGPGRTLDVFDGLNMPVDQIANYSAGINQSVAQSWQNNPLKHLSESFSKFALSFSLEAASKEEKEALVRALYDQKFWGQDIPADRMMQSISELDGILKELAMRMEARQTALSQVDLVVDQMAGAASPHRQTGKISLIGMAPEQVIGVLNELMQKAMTDLERKAKIEEATEVAAEIDEQATVHESGARLLRPADIRLMGVKLKASGWQTKILNDTIQSVAGQGYRVVSGSTQQLKAYMSQEGIPSEALNTIDPSRKVNGVTLPGRKIILLVNPTAEVLVHELVHAATYGKLEAFYAGQNLGEQSLENQRAIGRLEGLQTQFLNMDVSAESSDTQEAYFNAVQAIQEQSDKGNRAGALNEFMAWGLTNQKLANLQKKTKATGLALLAQNVIDGIRQLIWGKRGKTPAMTDMLSNLRFNSSILSSTSPDPRAVLAETTLFHSEKYGNNVRLTRLNEALNRKVVRHLKVKLGSTNDVADRKRVLNNIREMRTRSDLATRTVASAFPMNPQEKTTFQLMVSTMSSAVELDPNALLKAGELYQHVAKTLKVEDFLEDPDTADSSDRYYAQEKYNLVLGNIDVELDGQGRSSLLPMFLSLAIVNDEMQQVLSRMPLPPTVSGLDGTLDGFLENAGMSAMDSIGRMVSGQRKTDKKVQDVIDGLTDRIIETAENRKSQFDLAVDRGGNLIDRGNDWVAAGIERASETVFQKAGSIRDSSDIAWVKTAAEAAAGLSGIANRRIGNQLAENAVSEVNKSLTLPHWTRALMNDFVGRTENNAPIYDLIKRVRNWVQQRRQQFRENLPQIIMEQFSRELSDYEWGQMLKGVMKTDTVALRDRYTSDEVIEFYTQPSKVTQEISTLEAGLLAMQPKAFASLQRKGRQLAEFMNTGIPGSNLLRNAAALSRLLGESVPAGYNVAEGQETLIDALVSLYAIEQLETETKNKMSELGSTQKDGLAYVLSYLEGQRKYELDQVSGMATFNHYKGYTPSEQAGEGTLIVAKDDDYADLREKSFVRVGNYSGSTLEKNSTRKGYYFAPVSSRAAYQQGILQTVQQTAGGVDIVSGVTHGRTVAGVISDTASVNRAYKFRQREKGGNPLLPVWDIKGNIIAYERSVSPQELDRVAHDDHLPRVMGIWRGRQVEEFEGREVNTLLIDRLKEMYDADIDKNQSNQDEYVDLFDSRVTAADPVLNDIMTSIPAHTLEAVSKVFGENFYVRKDMLTDALGYRDPSIRNAWDQQSRWSSKTLDTVKSVLVAAMGNDAYRLMVNGEKTLKNVITDLRVLIVVKSVFVPAANLTWNVFQLASRGVPLKSIGKGFPRKVTEVDTYLKSRNRQIELEADLRAAGSDVIKIRKLEAEIQIIEDGHRRLSIWPLIEAGELTSISDGMLSKDDLQLSEGRLSEYIDKVADKLPPAARTAARYGLVGRDTALFKGLQRSIEYGDFLAKAVLYEHLTAVKGQTQDEALAAITEEYVNYDRLSGRDRGYLEQMGLLWFWNFKLRSTKVAVSMVRNNPVHALLAMSVPFPDVFGPVGSPLTDNAVTAIMEGRADQSIGAGMAFRAPSLNPWLNVIS